MPYRSLPNTDATRTKALTAAKLKVDALPPDQRFISPETTTSLTGLLANWNSQISDRSEALASQTLVTSRLDAAAATLRLLVSHFIQVYHFAIARGELAVTGRPYYQLSLNEETVPAIAAEADLLLWADRIVEGETLRVNALQEAPMANPAASQISAAATTYREILTNQTTAKDLLDSEQADVAALRPAADSLIKDIWDEVEFALRRLDPPSLRRRAREWGVTYALRPGEPAETQTPEPEPPAP